MLIEICQTFCHLVFSSIFYLLLKLSFFFSSNENYFFSTVGALTCKDTKREKYEAFRNFIKVFSPVWAKCASWLKTGMSGARSRFWCYWGEMGRVWWKISACRSEKQSLWQLDSARVQWNSYNIRNYMLLISWVHRERKTCFAWTNSFLYRNFQKWIISFCWNWFKMFL